MKKALLFALLLVIASAVPVAAAWTRFSDNITSNGDAVTLSDPNLVNVSVQITGTWTATLTFQGSNDGGSNWVSVTGTNVETGGTATSTTSNGIFTFNTPFQRFRVAATAYTSGTAVVTVVASSSGGGGGAGGGGGGGAVTQSGTWTMQPGNTANTTPWLTTPHDGSAAIFSPAAALSDNTANPTVGGIAAFIHCYDSAGGNWDRCLSGAATDTEDGTIAAGQSNVALTVGFRYEWDGTDYNRPAAHDEADTAGAPYKIGTRGTTSVSGQTMVANNDLTHNYSGIDGVLIVRPYANLEDRVSGRVANTDGASTSLVAAQGAGIRFCATTFVVSNSSATNVTVDIEDGVSGTAILTIPAAANMGGAVVNLPVPLCTTANTAMAMNSSSAATTVTVTAVGFKTKL